ncbi:IclR family transcriptional regulator [Streptosporangium sp. NBC_01756]|uniref:IclR family transcriptional regulator n=1 Tax=Streptosporangium sp. NBC_01756 TaxID=2975950 RepID=UPI002DDA966F|nr:IclR family transcriptional regulator [Streptosporangium sp. NBC_01756]WSC85696.1 IclR family transcriptional regulator [Streptosporangium sp. NBC_01756]
MVEQRKPHIASVMKAFFALSVVAERPESISAKALAEIMSAPLPTTYHLLHTLVAAGALAKGGNGNYRLGPRIGMLADAYLEQGDPLERLEAPLRALAADTGESAYLSAWRHGEIEVVAMAEGSHAVRVANLQRGAFGNGHARASGKLLLAYARDGVREQYLKSHPLTKLTPNTITDKDLLRKEFEVIRARGYAIEKEEFTLDVSCVAAPILAGGRVIGAYTVSSPTSRFQRVSQDLIATLVKSCDNAQDLFAE